MTNLFLKKILINSLLVNNSIQSSTLSLTKCTQSDYAKLNTKNLIIDKKEQLSINLNLKANETNLPVTEYLKSKSISFSQGWNSLNVFCCQKSKESFYLNRIDGNFLCLECNKTGNFSDFKNLVNKIEDNKTCDKSQTDINFELKELKIKDENLIQNSKYFNEWQNSQPIEKISESNLNVILRSSPNELNNFKIKTLTQHQVRVFESLVLYPIFDEKQNIIDIILLNSNEKDYDSSLKRSLIYSNKLLKSQSKRIFITDSILNLLTLNDKLTNSAISIGSLECLNFHILSVLEKYDEIIIWQKDKKLSYDLALVLNLNRCSMISISKSAYETCLNKDQIEKTIAHESFQLKVNPVIKFDELKSDIYSEVKNAKSFAGVQWTRFPQLNEILKGHRSDELTIFTGATGSGKTTFLSEYSLDLCMKGVKTLWGSFEIKNHRLAKIMMTQFAKINLQNNIELFEHVSNQFKLLPFYFMNFHGEQSIDNVLSTMSKSVFQHGVNHIVIDNLQFMMGTQFTNPMERFYYQDIVISKFRRFATEMNCHVTLVIHPRKEESDELLKISSIFGSAKASQEADNIMILQDCKNKTDKNTFSSKFVQITKNRFDGELGKFYIKFNKETLTFKSTKFDKEKIRDKNILNIDADLFEDVKDSTEIIKIKDFVTN